MIKPFIAIRKCDLDYLCVCVERSQSCNWVNRLVGDDMHSISFDVRTRQILIV